MEHPYTHHSLQPSDKHYTVELRSNKRSREWQNMFAMTRFRYIKLLFHILGLQPRDKAAMLWVNTIEIFFEEFT